jgi:hypothetical protein
MVGKDPRIVKFYTKQKWVAPKGSTIIQLLGSHFTDWAIPAHKRMTMKLENNRTLP